MIRESMQQPSPYNPRIGIVAGALEHLARIESYGVRRVELVMQDREQERAIRRCIDRNSWDISVHCPLFKDCEYDEYPLLAALFDTDPDRQAKALELMERELLQAADWGAMHLVVHLQRAVGIFREPIPAGWTRDRALDTALAAAERLSAASQRAGIPIHIENMMSHDLLAYPEQYAKLLDGLPSEHVAMCLDVGHLALDARHYGFDPVQAARLLGPRIGSLHLHNNRIPDEVDFAVVRENGQQKKYPIHPSQSPGEGWIDVGAVFSAVLEQNPLVLPTLEVYYALDTDRPRFIQGLQWIDDICAAHTPADSR